jgi:hypothetical protein
VPGEPEFGNLPGGSRQVFGADGFRHEGVDAEVKGTLDFVRRTPGGQSDDGEGFELKVIGPANGADQFKSVHARETQIEEHESREGEVCAVRVWCEAAKVTQGDVAGVHPDHADFASGLLKGNFEEESVIVTVFDE